MGPAVLAKRAAAAARRPVRGVAPRTFSSPPTILIIAGALLLSLATLSTNVIGQETTGGGETTGNGTPAVPEGPSLPEAPPPVTEPPPCEQITDVLGDLDFLSLTYRAIQSAGLLTALGSPAPFVTLLAPTNEAFREAARQLGLSSTQQLMGNTPLIRRIVEQHLLPFIIEPQDLEDGQVLLTLDFGNPLIVRQRVAPTLTFTGTGGSTNQMRLSLDYDICSASVILVDKVLIPADVFLSNAFLVTGMAGMEGANDTLIEEVESTLNAIGLVSSPETNVADTNPDTNVAADVSPQTEVADAETDVGDASPETEANGTAPSAPTEPQSASTTLDEADYDLSDFGVDIPGITGGLPSVGIRVPPLQSAQARSASIPQRDIRPLQQQNPTQPGLRQGGMLSDAGVQSTPKQVQDQSDPRSSPEDYPLYTAGIRGRHR